MRIKRIFQRRKARSFVYVIAFLSFLLPLKAVPLYGLQTQTADELNNLYVLNEVENQTVTIDVEEDPLLSVLKQVARKVHVGISYEKNIIPDQKVTVHLKETPVFEALKKILQGTHLKVVLPFSRDVLVIKKKQRRLITEKEQVQAGTITGTVTNAETGEPMPGVSVYCEGTKIGDATNKNGAYKITGVEPGEYTLIAQFIGYKRTKKE